jgi:hypothetical protein
VNPNATTTPRGFTFRVGYVVVALIVSLPILCILGITSYFRLSSETAALRDSVVKSGPDHWKKKFAVNVGWFTTGVMRTGLSFVKLDPEARAAAGAVRSFEVGLYNLDQGPSGPDRAAILTRADKAMTARGWERVVGVGHRHELVAVYLTTRNGSPEKMKCCVIVLEGRQLVVASLRGSLEPIVQIARSHGSKPLDHSNLAMR